MGATPLRNPKQAMPGPVPNEFEVPQEILNPFIPQKKFVKLVSHDRYKKMSRLRSTWQPIEKTFQEKRHAELVSASHAN
jgi:hypothetical protein